MAIGNRIVREGMSAGLIGASSIALWFALLDATQGHLLDTPIMLGTSLGSLFFGADTISTAAAFLGYTVFHFALFIGIGLVFSWVVNHAENAPSTMIGFAGLFIVFEVGWVGWTMVLAEGFGRLTWLQVFLANIIAVITMGVYMWRQHPELPGRVNKVVAGRVE